MMNKPIKQLAEQAREYVEDAIELGFPKDQVDDIRDERFAELIVRECLVICRMNNDSGEGGEISRQICEYFGVE